MKVKMQEEQVLEDAGVGVRFPHRVKFAFGEGEKKIRDDEKVDATKQRTAKLDSKHRKSEIGRKSAQKDENYLYELYYQDDVPTL